MRTSDDTIHSPSSTDVGNALLKAMPRAERQRFLASCDIVAMAAGDVLTHAEQARKYAFFPSDGLIALSAKVSGHPDLEIGLIGSESMLGSELSLGEKTSELRAVVISTGWAWRVSARRFRAALVGSSALQSLAQQAALQASQQFAHAAPCVRFHLLQQRLALWLLRAQDRRGAMALHVTHQQLANALGVQRSAVTLAAGKLQRLGLIDYVRGELHITDRHGLEAASCECYARGWRH